MGLQFLILYFGKYLQFAAFDLSVNIFTMPYRCELYVINYHKNFQDFPSFQNFNRSVSLIMKWGVEGPKKNAIICQDRGTQPRHKGVNEAGASNPSDTNVFQTPIVFRSVKKYLFTKLSKCVHLESHLLVCTPFNSHLYMHMCKNVVK